MKLEKYGIILETLSHDKIEVVRRWRNSDKIRQCMLYRDEITPEMQERWYQKIATSQSDCFFLIVYHGRDVGLINVKDIDREARCGESGIFVWDDACLHTGVALRATLCLYDYAFETLQLDRLVGHILSDNEASRRFHLKVGFRRCAELDICEADLQNQGYVLTREDYMACREQVAQRFAVGQIPFNKPYLSGHECDYLIQAVNTGKLSGNGLFTKKCQDYFTEQYGFRKCLLTTSGTDALEMCAMLCELKAGDEVIVPSYTFVSTALAFLREGAKVVFADSSADNPNLDADKLEALITPRTRVIVPVHYAGMACDMDKIMALAEKYHLIVVEDAAQAIDSYYKGKPLGGVGHMSAFSFHETKNITAGGEGGLLAINDERFVRRSEILWEKGTNRAEFFRGAVNKYGWVDMGSSFLPAEINAAFLWAQIENLPGIQSKRKQLWQHYYDELRVLEEKGFVRLPQVPGYASNNGHLFYLVCRNLDERTQLIACLKEHGVIAPFHYLSLHKSEFYAKQGCDIPELPMCDLYADRLIRLPLFYELDMAQADSVISLIYDFYASLQA